MVFRDYAERGKSTMGWYFGFKLHLDGTKLNIGLESPLPIMAYLLACGKVTTFWRICRAEVEMLFPVLLRERPQW